VRTLDDHPDRQIVDLQRALTQLGGDEVMLLELVEIFLREAPRWLQRLEEAVTHEDADEVFRRAHDIKGSTDIFGANAAVRAAQILERMGRDDDLDGADEALGVLKAELVWVRQALTALQDRS
jgi:two-component system, sensor histidine kinase and response regulator